MAAGGHFGLPKSLSIAFLAISDQYTTFCLFEILEVRFAPKTIGFFHYVLSVINGYAKYEVDW